MLRRLVQEKRILYERAASASASPRLHRSLAGWSVGRCRLCALGPGQRGHGLHQRGQPPPTPCDTNGLSARTLRLVHGLRHPCVTLSSALITLGHGFEPHPPHHLWPTARARTTPTREGEAARQRPPLHVRAVHGSSPHARSALFNSPTPNATNATTPPQAARHKRHHRRAHADELHQSPSGDPDRCASTRSPEHHIARASAAARGGINATICRAGPVSPRVE